jgi:Cdc6-like AAA superfamily ATPase
MSQRLGGYVIDPEIGFTSDVIRDPARFIGRTELLSDCIRALNSPLGLIAIYGKRGVGKSSLLRQIQQMALGDYELAGKAGLKALVPDRPRTYLTVFYTCDSMIRSGTDLLSRLCNDQNAEDGLLRLVPDDGKELVEFARSKEVEAGADLKVVKWGAKGVESSRYARVIPDDIVQTFRNFINAVVTHQVTGRMKRDGLLILLDEFDVIDDKTGLGSLIKSLSSDTVKFGICGVARDLNGLVKDHASVERLLEEGALHVRPMPADEAREILYTANTRFRDALSFHADVIERIVTLSEGYPYLIQMFGKACVNAANKAQVTDVTMSILDRVLNDIRSGAAFPTLESQYQRAIGNSEHRQLLLHLLAEQPEDNAMFNDEVGRVVLKSIRADAQGLGVEFIDQLMPRLVDPSYGPVLVRLEDRQGIYEFANPVFRVYVKLRKI